jgi:hypothetical protein
MTETPPISRAHDSLAYGYATGWAHLYAVADRVSLFAHDGHLGAVERDQIHDHLREVFASLDRLFDEGCDQLCIAVDARTYSDGTPIFSVIRPSGQLFSAAATYTADVGPVELEPGAEVIVEEPPHLRGDLLWEIGGRP